MSGIEKCFNLTHIEKDTGNKVLSDNFTNSIPHINGGEEDLLDSDFIISRNNLINIIEHSQKTIDELSSLAKELQKPGAYDIIANLLNVSLQANKDLLDLHNSLRKIKTITSKTDQPRSVVNNNLFCTTAELGKIIKQAKLDAEEKVLELI